LLCNVALHVVHFLDLDMLKIPRVEFSFIFRNSVVIVWWEFSFLCYGRDISTGKKTW